MFINDFHDVEKKGNLFDIVDKNNYPLWDILRYYIFCTYYYSEEDFKRLNIVSSKKWRDYLFLVKEVLKFILCILFIKKGKVLIQTASRFKDERDCYYDKLSRALITMLKSDCFILETNQRMKLAYNTNYDFSSIIRRFFKSDHLDGAVYNKIYNLLIDKFGYCNFNYNTLNVVYHHFQSDVFYYNFLINKLSPKKIFTSAGNPKALTWVARNNNIPILIFQHAGILFEEIEYSYPLFINSNSNIAFPDKLLTFGSYWGKGINIPVKKIVIVGNDYYYKIPPIKDKDMILIISTIIHGKLLAHFLRDYALIHKELNFVFKLHPNEFHLVYYYKEIFEGLLNIQIISSEIDTSDLVAQSQLVILIVSTVMYEALNQNKKVAIYKKLNYERDPSVFSLPNFYLFNSNEELDVIIQKEKVENVNLSQFYSPLNSEVLSNLI